MDRTEAGDLDRTADLEGHRMKCRVSAHGLQLHHVLKTSAWIERQGIPGGCSAILRFQMPHTCVCLRSRAGPLLLVLAGALAFAPAMGSARPAKPFVVLISIDGLKPKPCWTRKPRTQGTNLRAFMSDGVYATGVRGVLPTLTYPSHMTILTDSPRRMDLRQHTFDPLGRNERGCIGTRGRQSANAVGRCSAAHLKTANVYWPTSVAAITYNLPQIWRSGTEET